MKKLLALCLVILLCLPLVSACDTNATITDLTNSTTAGSTVMKTVATAAKTTAATTGLIVPPSPPQPLDNTKTYDILFIGNSHTYKNDMPTTYFRLTAQKLGYTVNVKAVTKGGYTLEEHLAPSGNTWGNIKKELDTGKYEFVIIQEQLTRPATHPTKFYASVRSFVEKITAAGATPILYATWGGAPGNSKLNGTGCKNSEELNYRVAASHQKISEELGIAVAYAGLAFMDIDRNHASVDLYADDGYHPSAAGSFLAALTIAETIFHVDPTTATGWTANQKNAEDLKEAARDAREGLANIPEQYRPAA